MDLKEKLSAIPAEYHETVVAIIEEETAGLKTNRDTILTEKKASDAARKKAEGDLAALMDEVEPLKKRLSDAAPNLKALTIRAAIAEQAPGLGMHPAAVRDAIRAASDVFVLADDGALATEDGVALDAWLKEAPKTAPHWFAQSSGRAAGGGLNNPSSRPTITRTDASNHQLWKRADAEARKLGYDGPEVVEG